MEHGIGHGRSNVASALARGAVTVVSQRLGSAVEHQANAHTGGEHHGNPRWRGKFRLLINVAQLDGAKLGGGNKDNEDHEDGAEEDIGPTEVVHDPGQGRRREVGKVIRGGQAPHNDGGDQNTGDAHDGPIDWHIVTIGRDFHLRIVITLRVETIGVNHILKLAGRRLCVQLFVYSLIILNRLPARRSRGRLRLCADRFLSFFWHACAHIFRVCHELYSGAEPLNYQTKHVETSLLNAVSQESSTIL